MYYDIDAVFDEATAQAMVDGKKLYYESSGGKITSESIDQKRRFVCETAGFLVSVIFDEQGGLYDYSCNCGEFDVKAGACKHIVAASLSLAETINATGSVKERPAFVRNSDWAATQVIKEYTKKRNTRFMPSSDRVDIEPIFCLNESGSPYLRLRLVSTRKYAVKNITDFLTAAENGSSVRYGASLKFRHDENSFTKFALSLIAFLQKCRKDRLVTESKFSCNKDEFSLTFGERDEFFELTLGKRIAFYYNNCLLDDRLVVDDEGFSPKLLVLGEGNGYLICFPQSAHDSLGGSDIIFEGRNFCYYITGNKIIRCKSKLWQDAAPLLTVIKTAKLFVSNSDMPVFYNNVLIRVAESVDIQSDGVELSSFSSPPLTAQIFLDRTYNGDTNVPETNKYKGIEATLKCRYGDTEIDIIAGDEDTIIYRDWESENRLKTTLTECFPNYPSLNLSEDADIYWLYKEGLARLYNFADIFIAESLAKVKIKKPPKASMGIRLSAGLLELDFEGTEYSDKELSDLAAAYNSGKKFVRMEDGSFIDITDEKMGALSGILSLGTRKNGKLTLPAYYTQYVEEQIRDGYLDVQTDEQYKRLLSDFDGYQNADVDFGGLSDTLRSYQKDGVKWLNMLKNHSFGGILADDMGLGKTIQTLAVLSQHNSGLTIVVCPTSLIINWAKEAAVFTPHLKTLQVMGSAKERADQINSIFSEDNVECGCKKGGKPADSEFDGERLPHDSGKKDGKTKNYDIIITSYELLRRDMHLYEGINFEIAVLDEAQYIKNHETLNARAVKGLKAKFRFALTGTPIENSLSELWSIFDFLMPGYLYSYGKFRTKFEAGIVKGNAEIATALKKMVRPFILRRLKSSVLQELPPKIESEITVPLIGSQKELYEKHLALIKQAVESGEAKDKITVLSMLTRLRQICCDPSLIDESYSGNSEKLSTCIDLLKNVAAASGKVLVFSQFTSMLDIIAKRLNIEDISYFVLEGSTPKKERNRLIDKFNQDDTPVFLISLRAGGTGINLTGADTVVHFDPWWNDPVMNQATDRAHRIGQRKSVSVYKLLIKDSIEERIVSLRQKKSALAGLFVEDEAALPISELISLLL